MEQTHALGRRKAAVARVYLTPGAGNVTVNGRALETYFALDSLRYIVNQPFEVTSTLGQFDVKVTVIGGGIKGQAEAIRLGIARALSELDREAYRSALKAAGVHAAASSSVNVSYCPFYGTAAVLNFRCP